MQVNKNKLTVAMLNAGVDSLKHLSELSGVSVNTLSRINNGNSAKIPTIKKLAFALGVDPKELLAD